MVEIEKTGPRVYEILFVVFYPERMMRWASAHGCKYDVTTYPDDSYLMEVASKSTGSKLFQYLRCNYEHHPQGWIEKPARQGKVDIKDNLRNKQPLPMKPSYRGFLPPTMITATILSFYGQKDDVAGLLQLLSHTSRAFLVH